MLKKTKFKYLKLRKRIYNVTYFLKLVKTDSSN